MNAITQVLLAGAAFGALATAPALAAGAPHSNFTALHAGRVVNKTRIHNPARTHLTYTFSAYTTIPASDLYKTVHVGIAYKFNSYSTVCSNPRQKIKVFPKKTKYGRAGTYTETYSYGCASGPTVFYGPTYKLTDPAGEGRSDYFVPPLSAGSRTPAGSTRAR